MPSGSANLLKQIPLFKGLPQKDLQLLAGIAQPLEINEGETIFSKATRGDMLYVLMKGRVKIFSRSRMGKTKIFAYLEPMDFFGEMALLEAEEGRSAGAEAMLPSTLLTIRRKDFQEILGRRPALALTLLETMSARLRHADREIESMSFNSVFGRVVRTLLNLSARYGETEAQGVKITLKLSHRELADMVGTAREMVTRVIMRLQRAGCLAVHDKEFILTDIPKLKEWVF